MPPGEKKKLFPTVRGLCAGSRATGWQSQVEARMELGLARGGCRRKRGVSSALFGLFQERGPLKGLHKQGPLEACEFMAATPNDR